MLAAVNFAAGETKTFLEVGDFFRILSAGAVVDLDFFFNGAEIVDAPGVNPGYSEKFSKPFDKVTIRSATVQTVQFVIRLGNEVSYDGAVALVGGGMQVTGETAITQGNSIADLAPVSVGLLATALVAADATRKRIIFANYGVADVFLGSSGVTTVNGALKVPGGGTWIEDDGARAAWWGISGTAAQSVRIQEVR